MAERVLTPRQQQIVDEMRASIVGWIEAEAKKSLEEKLAEFHARNRKAVKEMNAWPFDKKLEFLARHYDCAVESIRASVANVWFEWSEVKDDPEVLASMIFHIGFTRPIEVVHMTLRISDPGEEGVS